MRGIILMITIIFLIVGCTDGPSDSVNKTCKVCSDLLYPANSKGVILSAYQTIHLKDDVKSAESMLSSSIQKFRSSLAVDSFVYYGAYFLLLPDLSKINSSFAEEIVNELEKNASGIKNPQLKAILHYSLNHYYYQIRDALQCFNHAHKLNSVSPEVAQEVKVLESIAYGRAHELAFDYKSALNNFLAAYYRAEEIQNLLYKRLILRELSNFYIRNNIHTKAYEYKLMEMDLYGNDSISYYYAVLEKLECIRRINKDGNYDLAIWREVVNFSSRASVKRLSVFAFAFLRTSHLDLNKALDLYHIYTSSYPEEFEEFKNQEVENYLKFMAAYHESMGKTDSAEYYFQRVFNLDSTGSLRLGSIYSLYLRYGDFKFRNGEQDKALQAYLRSFNAANKLNITKHQLIAAQKLKEIYQAANKNNDAIHFIQVYHSLQDRIDSVQHDREIVKMELDNSEQIILLQKRLETEHRNKIHENQYNLIAVLIGLVFIVLLAAVQLHVPIWIIRTLGFLFFIFLFEFLIIKLDKQIHYLTHEIPWKLFAVKVVLFSMLLPFHHWLEKRVVHYLVEKRASGSRLVKLDRKTISDWFQNWNQPG